MRYLGGAALAIGFGTWCTAAAAAIPEVLISPSNQAPACATPGRLMAFVKDRNPALRPRFHKIAMDYMRHGEALRIRWDFAFFQMMLETASLKFNGDVNWSQNNFAGLGATGGGVKGERFASVSDGVRAHLEHLLIYAGVRVENPVADRTRKVQSWNILDKWRRTISGPMTFGHIGRKWAPGDRGYTADIKSIADAFYSSRCNGPDPEPELLAEARGQSAAGGQSQIAAAQTGEQRAPNAISALNSRASLGAATVYRRPSESGTGGRVTSDRVTGAGTAGLASSGVASKPTRNPLRKAGESSGAAARLDGNVQVLNPAATTAGNGQTTSAAATVKSADKPAKVASAGQLAAKFATPWINPATRRNDADGQGVAKGGQQSGIASQAKPSKCRVWTASYGGAKAIIIQSADNSHVNYTVLDVNPGREQQEAAAYIAAYAQGGKKIAEFNSQTLALDKAFKLCPDG